MEEQSKYNEELCDYVRKGQTAICFENQEDYDLLVELLGYIFPNTKSTKGISRYYFKAKGSKLDWAADNKTTLPTHDVRNFFFETTPLPQQPVSTVEDEVRCGNCGSDFHSCECGEWNPVYGQTITPASTPLQEPVTLENLSMGNSTIEGIEYKNGQIQHKPLQESPDMGKEAKSLIERFEDCLNNIEMGSNGIEDMLHGRAKQCALIHCDLMIEAFKKIGIISDSSVVNHYQQLKQTINKL